jgi:hypothetical protein
MLTDANRSPRTACYSRGIDPGRQDLRSFYASAMIAERHGNFPTSSANIA